MNGRKRISRMKVRGKLSVNGEKLISRLYLTDK